MTRASTSPRRRRTSPRPPMRRSTARRTACWTGRAARRWASGCGSSPQSPPGLNKIYKDLNAKGLKVYAVDLEEPKEKIQPVAAKVLPDLTVLMDENSTVSKMYGVSGIPRTVVIGKDGKVKKVF